MAAGSIFAGIFREPYDIGRRRSRIGVGLSFGAALLLILLIDDPFKGLICSQALLSLQLPFTIFLQVRLTSSQRVMGSYRNSPAMRRLLWSVGAVVTLLNILLLASFIG